MNILGLSGIFTGLGFAKKLGTRPQFEDAGFIKGPLNIEFDKASGKILKISPTPSNEKNSRSVEGSGLYATAGFVDSHTHALFMGSRAAEFFLRWSGASYKELSDAGGGIHNTVRDTEGATSSQLVEACKKNLRDMLRFGSTTVEVKSGYASSAQGEIFLLRALKEIEKESFAHLPDIKKTFLALHALPRQKTESDFVDEAIATLSTLKAESLADFVDAFPEKGFFSLEHSLRFALVAKKLGFGIKVHCDEITNMLAAKSFAELGALSVDHLQMIDEAGIEACLQHKVVATMLPATSFYLGLAYAPARKLIDAGLAVALSTDFNPGTAPCPSMPFTNLLAANSLKMTAPEIFCASTFNGARALGLSDRGILKEGLAGDLLLWRPLSKNPQDILQEIILANRGPEQVIRRGNLILSS